jgi:hypothetical protein
MTFYPDVLPKLLIEIREDSAVDAIVEGRVRGFEPEGESATYEGDALGAGKYKAFVVLVQLDAGRLPRAPIQFPRIAARCYGRTHAEAAELRWAVSNAIHNTGPRIHTNDLGIYNSIDDGGGQQEKDPDTAQPYQTLFIEAPATTQVATA